jgi:hypothetical protein
MPRAPLQGVLPESARRPALARPTTEVAGGARFLVPIARRDMPRFSRARRRAAVADDLPGLLLPFSASGIGNPLHAGLAVPPRSGRSVSHALAGLRLPNPLRAYFIPVTLLGFDLQGVLLPQGRSSLEDRSSRAVSDPRAPVRATQAGSASEVCSLRESVPSASGEARSAADTLLAFDSLGLSLLLPRHRLPGASSLALGRPKPRGRREAGTAEFRLAGGPAFLLAERRPLWAFSPRRRGHLSAALAFR